MTYRFPKAAAEGRSSTALIEERLRQMVNEGSEGAHLPPRVSTARGDLTRGIDLDGSTVLAEMNDLEYLKRQR